VSDREKKTPANKEAAAIDRRCLESGLIIQLRGTRPGRKNVFRFVPPMTTTDAEIDRALSILEDAFVGVLHGRTRATVSVGASADAH